MVERVIHAPKVESFDIPAMTNTDPKGYVRTVDSYRREPFGLYMARPTPGRRQFHYLESWILPELGIRVSDFHTNEGYRAQDFYIDVVSVAATGDRWVVTDLYLDLALYQHDRVDAHDVDELLDAVLADHLGRDIAERALHTGFSATAGLAASGYDLATWLATFQITLSWQRWPQRTR